MAIFRLQIEPVARAQGGSAPGAAAYRAGERIRDERTGELHNHSRRKDVTHKEIMLPAHLSGADMAWARSRATLWNVAEQTETRKRANVAREIQVTLPVELPAERRLELARRFSQEVADHYKVAVDLAVHDPRPDGDPRNFHAHLLLTTREVTPSGLGAKTGLDLGPRERVKLGLPDLSSEFTAVRERWATVTNEALRAANLDVRVDHRSLAAQGVDREPRPYIPFAEFRREKSGLRSEMAEEIRARYNERVAARGDAAVGQEAAVADNAAATPVPTLAASAVPTPTPAASVLPDASTPPPASTTRQSLAEIRREARENWLRMRAAQVAPAEKQPADQHKSRDRDDDHTP